MTVSKGGTIGVISRRFCESEVRVPPPMGVGWGPEKSGKLEKTRKKSGKFEKVRYSFLKPGFLLTRLRAVSLLFSNLLYPLSHFFSPAAGYFPSIF